MLARVEGLVGKRYEVQSLLGQGGMGAVYRARDRLTGQLVALKRVAMDRVSSQHAPTAQLSKRLARPLDGSTVSGPRALRVALAQEFRTLAALRHPNIVSVLDYGFDDANLPFFTMEYLANPHNLLVASLPLPLAEKLELVAQLLGALTYLHRHGILHRDLKPSNVLVIRDAAELRLKVLDFGIAIQMGSALDVAGTTAYMAPEVRLGQEPAPGSDLYAVGIILYLMLTRDGRHEAPHTMSFTTAASTREQIELTLSVAPVEHPSSQSQPSDSRTTDKNPAAAEREPAQGQAGAFQTPAISGRLAAVVTRLLEPDPRNRYLEAASVLQDLSRVMDEIAARPLMPETAAARESFLQAAELVGRDQELCSLEAALTAARHGSGAVILVGGESGSGKSRLLEELRTTALVSGVRAMRGQAVSDGGTAYQVFSDVLPQLVLELPINNEEAAALKELVSELPTLLGRPLPDAAPLSPQAAQQRLHQVLLTTLTRSPEPVLLLLEDLHWAAPEDLALVKELAELAVKLPLLLVASYRDDERADLPQLVPAAVVMKLPRLTPAEIAALSFAMLGESGTSPELVAYLNRETEGNVSITHLGSSVWVL